MTCSKALLLLGALTIYSPGVFSNTIDLVGNSPIYEGGSASFSIRAPFTGLTVSAVRWTINGIPVDELSDLTSTVTGVGSRLAELTITNVSTTFNGSIVSCTAVVDMANLSCTPEATLQVQGILGPVMELPQQYNALTSTVNISWIPPSATLVPEFNLNIDRPEIFYCVQVFDGATTTSIGCNRTEDRNEETSIILDNAVCMVEYNVTIIPFNRLGDGTATIARFPATPVISDSGIPQISGNNISYTYEVSGLACSCRIEDQSIGSNIQCEVDMANPGQLILTLLDAILNRISSATLFAINTRASSSERIEMSTFDVSNMVISGSASQVDYSLVFIGGSNARGAFITLLFRADGMTNFTRSLYFVQNISGAQMANQISMRPGGSYMALAYDIEETGEITSDRPADQEDVMVTGPNMAGDDLMPLEDINCTSYIAGDMITVSVRCEYVSTTYSGYRAYIQSQATPTLSFVPSDSTGSTVTLNTTSNGDYLVFVIPIWQSSTAIPDQRMAPAHTQVHTISGHVATATPTTDQDTTSDSSQQEISSSESSPDSSDTTTKDETVVSGDIQSDTELVIGVVVGIIIVMIIAALGIVFIAIFLVRWNKRRKSVFVEAETDAFIMSDRDNKRIPSDSEILPVYATTGPPPNKSSTEAIKANGNDAPPSETAPTPSGGATALYSSVDLNQKRKEREAKNGSIKENKKGNSAEATPALVEPANLYASVDDIQKNKTVQAEERAQEQAHQEPQYETVQLKLKKPTQEKVEDEHLVEYASIDHLKKAAPEPKKEEPPKKESVETPHVQEKTRVRCEDCYEVLSGMAARWQEFARKVGASEDFVDEIDCNNMSDVGCLNHFLSLTVILRSKEEMSVALVEMGLMEEAQAMLKLPRAPPR